MHNPGARRAALYLCRGLFVCALLISWLLMSLPYGHSPLDYSALSSHWNDEVLYFKQVEGVLAHGLPQGYFGYNETHAQALTFGAWGPFFVAPYALFGAVFGWTLSAPFLCNVLLILLGSLAFVWLARPTALQSLCLLGVTLCCDFYSRYMLSGMTEAVHLSVTFLAAGLVFRLDRGVSPRKWPWAMGLLIAACLYAACVRPTMILLLGLPLVLALRARKPAFAVASGAAMIAALLLYVVTNRYLCAPFFYTSLDFSFLDALRESGLPGLWFAVYQRVRGSLSGLWQMTRWLLDGQGSQAAVYLAAFAQLLVLAALLVRGFRKRRQDWLLWFCFLSNLCALAAIFLIYYPSQGSRIYLPFLFFTAFVLVMRGGKPAALSQPLALLVLFLLFPYHRQQPLPFADDTALAYYRQAEAGFAQIELEADDTWANTILLLDSDEGVTGRWQLLYAAPEGMGINLATPEFVLEGLAEGTLQSRYIFAIPGAPVANALANSGARWIFEGSGFVLYENPWFTPSTGHDG